MITRRALGLAALASPVIIGHANAQAQRLRWAHVYEVNEAYHTEALWAAAQFRERTNGKYNIEVFAASALGNEPQINQGLTLGTIDMIYTGVAFAGASYRAMSISHAPYAMRDYAHFQAYRGSALHRELIAGYDAQTRHHAVALTYYGDRMVTANKSIMTPADMRGLKLRVPQAPLLPHVRPRRGRQCHPHRLCRGLSCPAKRHGGCAGKPAADHPGEEVL